MHITPPKNPTKKTKHFIPLFMNHHRFLWYMREQHWLETANKHEPSKAKISKTEWLTFCIADMHVTSTAAGGWGCPFIWWNEIKDHEEKNRQKRNTESYGRPSSLLPSSDAALSAVYLLPICNGVLFFLFFFTITIPVLFTDSRISLYISENKIKRLICMVKTITRTI